MATEDISVLVTAGGKVEVNGLLVAEVAVGQVATRDELVGNLKLHRIASIVHRTLSDVARLCEASALPRRTTGKTPSRWEPTDYAEGLVDGLADRLVLYPAGEIVQSHQTRSGEVPPSARKHTSEYVAGENAGRMLRAMLRHLDEAAGTGENA